MRLDRPLEQIVAFFLAFTLVGTAQASTPASAAQFFGALGTRPELAAAHAAVEAAEAGLAQAHNPVALDLNVASNTRAGLGPVDTRVGVGVTAYPFRYGQPGDVLRLRELDLERAQLALREARTLLEARAFESALAVNLAHESLQLVRTSAEASAAGFTAAQLRFRRGLATPAELRSAAAERQRAQNLVASAEANAALAEATLTELVGQVRLKKLPKLEVTKAAFALAVPPFVRRAELDVTAAQIGQDGSARPFYPVAELSYSYDVSSQNRLSASLSSQDLAPRVGYSFDYNGYDDAPRLALRVSATLAPEQVDNVTRLTALRRSAAASLAAAQQNAAVTEAQLRTRLAEVGRNKRLAELVFENAVQNLAEVRERETLGAGTPLETQAAAAALADAGLELRDARQTATTAQLDLYRFFGLPLSATPGLETP